MIVCTIDGKVGVPSSSEEIKVTFENQYIRDSGSYTYDISFPMSIHENQVLFGNVQRMDVKKTLPDYEDCKLYVDNILVMSGKATVTNITNETVKLQLVGGKSRIKYNAKFESHYIDEIDYPRVVVTKGLDRIGYTHIPRINFNGTWPLYHAGEPLMVDFTDYNFVGQPGVAAFNPINDEHNENTLNNNIVWTAISQNLRVDGNLWPKGERVVMYNLAVQPFLMYVIKKVMEYEGYKLTRNDFDVEPWNRLLIANAMNTVNIKDALPHWKVYTFLEEIRKLFNASIVFDELAKTVKILSTNELGTNDIVSYDCSDEYTCEYDEDGLSNLSTSNIEYDFDSSANHDWSDYISQSVQKQFETKKYNTYEELFAAYKGMKQRERRTNIFQVDNKYYISAMVPGKYSDPDSEEVHEKLTQCGFFNPIIRDMESDDFVSLKISPVAIVKRRKQNAQKDFWTKTFIGKFGDLQPNKWVYVPSVPNEKQASLDSIEVDGEGDYYTAVQDAMEGVSEETTTTTEDDVSMPIMFQSQTVYNLASNRSVAYNEKLFENETLKARIPKTYTSPGMNEMSNTEPEEASLSLSNILGATGNLKIDKHNLITYDLITEDIPDPSKLYLLRNKKYVCAKIEVYIRQGKISNMKKGYFYEVL